MNRFTEPVLCVECGKLLRGTPRIHGWSVRWHDAPRQGASGPAQCDGHKRTDHIPVPRKTSR